jgi:hypothetical protein
MGIIEDLGVGGQQLPAPVGSAGPSGVGFTPYPRSGYAIHPVCPATSTSAPINGYAGASPFVIPAAGVSISKLVIEVSVAGSAGALARPVLWADDGTYYPGSVLWDCPDASRIDVTTTGVKTLDLTATPITLASAAADYVIWGAVITQGAPTTAPTYRASSGMVPFILTPPGNAAAAACGYTRTGLTGTASAWTGAALAIATAAAQLRLVCA